MMESMQHLLLALALLIPAEHDFVVHNFQFKTGETLAEVRIHYVTIGDPHGKPVLILHGTGGSSKQFLNEHFAGVLFKEGGVLDARTHYIVIPDNVGHGQSSKPSDGLRARFPHYDYDDMIELQHRLLADGLHIDHAALVMGTSMGGMQTWMWGERWPRFMDALVPLASAPVQIAGRNRVWRKMAIDDLQRGDVARAVHMKTRLAGTDADDLLYALEASRNYDPSPNLEKIEAPLVAINSADDFVNPPELGILEREIKRVKRGRYVLIPTSAETHGHGTHTWPALWQEYLRSAVVSTAGSAASRRP